jgi:hypothetical protein
VSLNSACVLNLSCVKAASKVLHVQRRLDDTQLRAQQQLSTPRIIRRRHRAWGTACAQAAESRPPRTATLQRACSSSAATIRERAARGYSSSMSSRAQTRHFRFPGSSTTAPSSCTCSVARSTGDSECHAPTRGTLGSRVPPPPPRAAAPAALRYGPPSHCMTHQIASSNSSGPALLRSLLSRLKDRRYGNLW